MKLSHDHVGRLPSPSCSTRKHSLITKCCERAHACMPACGCDHVIACINSLASPIWYAEPPLVMLGARSSMEKRTLGSLTCASGLGGGGAGSGSFCLSCALSLWSARPSTDAAAFQLW